MDGALAFRNGIRLLAVAMLLAGLAFSGGAAVAGPARRTALLCPSSMCRTNEAERALTADYGRCVRRQGPDSLACATAEEGRQVARMNSLYARGQAIRGGRDPVMAGEQARWRAAQKAICASVVFDFGDGGQATRRAAVSAQCRLSLTAGRIQMLRLTVEPSEAAQRCFSASCSELEAGLSARYWQCEGQDGSTETALACLWAERGRQRPKMEAALARVSRRSGADGDRWRRSQVLWRTAQSAYCDYWSATFGDGTLANVTYSECWLLTTIGRRIDLDAIATR